MPAQPPASAGAAPGPDFLEDAHQLEPWLAAEAQQARRSAFGLDEPRAAAFTSANEFVSLGCFCGVARSLQALGLKRFAYPFDWVRCPVDGIIHCLEMRFEDFLTFTASCQPPYVKQKVFTTSRWGGSFWHHDPTAPGTADVFLRRAERFLGLREVPATQARIFVWALNSTREINTVPRLFDCLQRALPQARIRLLVLIDLQRSQGPVCLKGTSSNSVLFYLLHEDIFGPRAPPPAPQQPQPPQPSPQQPGGGGWSMQRHAENYAEAVAFAAKYWAGLEGTLEVLRVVPNLASLSLLVGQWDGGSPTNELFYPRPLLGPRLRVQPAYAAQVTPQPVPMPFPQLQSMPLLGTRASSTGGRSDGARRSPSPARAGTPTTFRPLPESQLGKLDQSLCSTFPDSMFSLRREEPAPLPFSSAGQRAELAAAEQRLAASERRVAQLKQANLLSSGGGDAAEWFAL